MKIPELAFLKKNYLGLNPGNLKIIFLLLTFTVSFGYSLIYQIKPTVDAKRYNTVAINVLTKHTFCETCDVPLAKDSAIQGVGPGYQFFLVGVYGIFGIHLWIVWLIQALMHTAVVAWLWTLLKKMLPETSAKAWQFILPLGLYAFHPDIVQLNAMIMTEPLFIFLIVGAVRLGYRLIEQKNTRVLGRIAIAILLGLVLGAVFMIRPTGIVVLIALVATLTLKKYWREAIIVVLTAMLLQMPWAIRNANVYDKFILNSVVGGLDIWVGLHPEAKGEFEVPKSVAEQIKGLDSDALEYLSLHETTRILREMPVHSAIRTAQKGFKLFALSKTSGFWFHYYTRYDQALTLLLSIGFNSVMLGLVFAAMFEILWRRKVRHWLIGLSFVSILGMAACSIISVVIFRYRLPLMPFMVLLIGSWLTCAEPRDRIRTLAASGIFLVAATTIDFWGNSTKVLERLGRIINK